ncbi:TPA: MmgE/PrpD family protein, partial [Burkholderia cepacia]|nr:MmgE/PrpD family protein [Burkholderia cepacia]
MSTPETLSAPAAAADPVAPARPAPPDGIVGALGRFAAEVRAGGLEYRLRVEAAARVLDVVGNSLIAHDEPVVQSVLQVARRWAGTGPASVIGAPDRL